MDYNPHTAPYAELLQRISSAERDQYRRQQLIAWYDSFDVDAVFSSVQKAARERTSLREILSEIDARLENQSVRAAILLQETGFSFDPRDWFSSARSAKKAELDALQKDIEQLRARQKRVESDTRDAAALLERQHGEINRYRSFNRHEEQAVVNARSIEISHLEDQLAQIRQKKEEVDEQLARPLADHREYEQRKTLLEAEIRRAEVFNQQLSTAANGYERKQIHEHCGAIFGDSKPSKVIESKRRELESVNRSIEKLEARLRLISTRATRVIKTLVIDGNNLCHQHDKFIGLPALRTLAERLSNDYSVIIVFDPTIRNLLRMSRSAIAMQFSNAVVHVVSPPHAADETILDAAAGAFSYVISNDRFQEYRDKPAVRDQRILRHEILANQIFIHELSVAETFDAA